MKRKTLISAAGITLLVMGLFGAATCHVSKKESENKLFVEHFLENKYHEEFEVTDVKFTANTGRYTFQVRLKNKPGWTFYVTTSSEHNNTPSDEYRETVWNHQAMAALQPVVDRFFSQPHPLIVNVGLPVKLQESLYPKRVPSYQELLEKHGGEMSQYVELLFFSESSDQALYSLDEHIFQLVQHLQRQGLPKTSLEITVFDRSGSDVARAEVAGHAAFYALKNKLDKQWLFSINLEQKEMAIINAATDISTYKRDMRKR